MRIKIGNSSEITISQKLKVKRKAICAVYIEMYDDIIYEIKRIEKKRPSDLSVKECCSIEASRVEILVITVVFSMYLVKLVSFVISVDDSPVVFMISLWTNVASD